MTLLADPPVAARERRRIWDAPLGAHVAALAVALLALVPLIGTGASFSADEGAAIIQARSLSRGDGWVVEHPAPEVDPEGKAYPLELSERGPEGIAPFGKHPLYAVMLAGADRVAGVTGMVLLSVLGTVVAAGLAGLLAAWIGPALARPTVWVTGLATPLLFDGYLVIAHTLGAACAVGAVLAAAIAFERRNRLTALAVLPCVAGAVLLRTEAVLLAAGLAVAAVLVGIGRERLVAAIVAAGALVGAFVAREGEAAWLTHVLGGPGAGTGPTNPIPTNGFVADRWQGFTVTWMGPSYDASDLVRTLLVVMFAALLFGAYAARRHRPGGRTVAVAAGASALLALLLAPDNVVPGLLIACPLVGVGVVLAGRDTLATTTARLAAVTAAVFALGVLATQYPTGGSGEWGGRYFASALPIALPVLLLAIRTRASRHLLTGLLVCSLAMAVMAVGALRSSHRFGEGLITAVDRVSGPDRPVIVTTSPVASRMAWPTFDRQRWLLSKPDDLAALAGRFGPAGIQRFTFVARDGADLDRLPSSLRQEVSTTHGGWRIVVLEAPAGPKS